MILDLELVLCLTMTILVSSSAAPGLGSATSTASGEGEGEGLTYAGRPPTLLEERWALTRGKEGGAGREPASAAGPSGGLGGAGCKITVLPPP